MRSRSLSSSSSRSSSARCAPSIERISSSSFTWIASESRFCVFWIRNTIRNVTIVVPVLMMSCQVSLKPNSGPVTAHDRMIATATQNVAGCPALRAVLLANRVNHDPLRYGRPCMAAALAKRKPIPRSANARGSRRVPLLLQHRRHLLMDQVDGLEWPDHDLELDDPAGVVPLDQVHAVDRDTVDLDLELERGVVRPDDLADITERLVEEDLECRGEVERGDGLAHLRGVHDGRMEDAFVRQQCIETRDVTRAGYLVPFVKGGHARGSIAPENPLVFAPKCSSP